MLGMSRVSDSLPVTTRSLAVLNVLWSYIGSTCCDDLSVRVDPLELGVFLDQVRVRREQQCQGVTELAGDPDRLASLSRQQRSEAVALVIRPGDQASAFDHRRRKRTSKVNLLVSLNARVVAKTC